MSWEVPRDIIGFEQLCIGSSAAELSPKEREMEDDVETCWNHLQMLFNIQYNQQQWGFAHTPTISQMRVTPWERWLSSALHHQPWIQSSCTLVSSPNMKWWKLGFNGGLMTFNGGLMGFYGGLIGSNGNFNGIWLVVDLPLWKIMDLKSVGMMKFQYDGKNNSFMFLKPPTRYGVKIGCSMFLPCLCGIGLRDLPLWRDCC